MKSSKQAINQQGLSHACWQNQRLYFSCFPQYYATHGSVETNFEKSSDAAHIRKHVTFQLSIEKERNPAVTKVPQRYKKTFTLVKLLLPKWYVMTLNPS